MTELLNHRRLPWVAVALSFLATGVGHIYCGRIARGLVLYLAWFVVPVLGLIGAMLPVSATTLLLFVMLPRTLHLRPLLLRCHQCLYHRPTQRPKLQTARLQPCGHLLAADRRPVGVPVGPHNGNA